MSRVSENQELIEYLDNGSKDPDIVASVLDDPTIADTLSFASISSYLMDISKSLAMIADDIHAESKAKEAIKALGEDLRDVDREAMSEQCLIGFNMAVALTNKHLGGE